MCVCFAWLFDADGDLALIDPKEPVLERERERDFKPMSIKYTPLLRHHNPMFDLQDTLNPNQATQYLQIGGDTLNPSQITQHPQMGGDTSNPHIWR